MAAAIMLRDGWPGGFETAEPEADRPISGPQTAGRSVRPADLGSCYARPRVLADVRLSEVG